MYAKNSMNNFNIEIGNVAGYMGNRGEIINVIKKDAKNAYRKKGIRWISNNKEFHVKDQGLLNKNQLMQLLNNERINGRRKYERNVFVDGKLISKSNRPDYSKWKDLN